MHSANPNRNEQHKDMAMELEKGARYRVVKEGASLLGMQPASHGSQKGWKMEVPVGTILTCNGTQMTFGDGVPVVTWLDEHGKWIANDCEFRPLLPGRSMWSQKPDTSYLEQVTC